MQTLTVVDLKVTKRNKNCYDGSISGHCNIRTVLNVIWREKRKEDCTDYYGKHVKKRRKRKIFLKVEFYEENCGHMISNSIHFHFRINNYQYIYILFLLTYIS